jgi:hypothetical protein
MDGKHQRGSAALYVYHCMCQVLLNVLCPCMKGSPFKVATISIKADRLISTNNLRVPKDIDGSILDTYKGSPVTYHNDT